MKFKIKTDEVRKAAKKYNREIESNRTLDEECGCPIGILFTNAKKGKVSEYCSTDIFEWANRKYGRDFVNGFVSAFDYPENAKFEYKNTKNKKYKLGIINGVALAKSLLKYKENEE